MINIEKFQKAVIEMDPKFGPFDLFALFLRSNAPGVWDLVVSSHYLEQGKMKGLSEFVDDLDKLIGEEEFAKISSIYTMEHDSEGLQIILRKVGKVDGIKEIRDERFYQVEVERGYVLKANTDLLQVENV